MQRPMTRLLKGLVDTLLTPAADPRVTYIDSGQRQRTLAAQVQQALVQLGTAKLRLEEKTERVRDKLPLLEEQARQALAAGRENLARLALERRQVALAELQALDRQLHEMRHEEQRLTLVEQRLAAQLEALTARQEIIAARLSAAEAQLGIGEQLAGVSQELSDLSSDLVRAEERTEYMQARATAIDRLVNEGILELPGLLDDDLGQPLGPLAPASDIDAELERLRRQVRETGSPPPR